MKSFLIAALLAPTLCLASTYHCFAPGSNTTADFHFEKGVATDATMTFKGIFHESFMMTQFMEDYQEVAGKSLYVQVAMLTNSLIFDVKPDSANPAQWTGHLHVFGDGPMTTEALSCSY